MLTEDLARVIATDRQAMDNVKAMFKRYLEFAGLELFERSGCVRPGENPYRIAKTSAFRERHSDVWGGAMNHNWLRISRILKCFGMLGLVHEQQAFFDALQSLWGCGEIAQSARRSYEFWIDSAGPPGGGSTRTVPPHPAEEEQRQRNQRSDGDVGSSTARNGLMAKLCCHL